MIVDPEAPGSGSIHTPSRPWTRLAAVGLVMAAAVGLMVVTNGQPVLVAIPGALFALLIMLAPLIGLVLTIVAHIIWLIGAFAPGGIGILAMSKVFTGLTFLAWLHVALRDRVQLTYAPHMIPLALFLAVVVAGPFLTPAFEDSLVGIGKYAMMVLPYFLVANLATHVKGLRVAAMAISLAATCAALLALVERFLPGIDLTFGSGIALGAHTDDVSLAGGVAIKRVTGGIGDANWFSYTMATALPLCVYWFMTARSHAMRLVALSMAALQAFGIVLSYTRTPLLGVAGALVYLVYKRRIPLLPATVAAAAIVATAPVWLPQGFVDRFFSAKYVREGSTPMRREIFEMALHLIEMRPLLGHGYQQFGPQFIAQSNTEMGAEWERRDEDGSEPAHLLRAHNLFLDVWVMHGLVGLLPLVLMYLLLLRELQQVSTRGPPEYQDMAVALSACLIAFFLCGMGGHSQELKIFWVMAGLTAALRRVAFGGATR